MQGSRDPAWMWTRYWRGGRHECCVGDQPFDLSAVWRDWFSTLAPHAHFLDLATGAGQVASLAVAARRGFTVVGVDAADLGPPRAGGPRLIGNTRLEKLPFDDASFDAVGSQFGIEYAERGAALAEAARVLKPGGRGRFVLHHAEGAIAAAARTRLALHKAVVGAGEAFRAAERVYRMHLERAPAPFRIQAEAKLREIVAGMRARLGPRPDDNIAQIVGFLIDLAREPARYDPADALRRLAVAEDEVEGWRLRQAAQQAAALSPAAMEDVRAGLAGAGLVVDPAAVVSGPGGALVAWRLDFGRPA